jgi:hypothetical protein
VPPLEYLWRRSRTTSTLIAWPPLGEREAAERAHAAYERAEREEAKRLDAARRAAERNG